MQGPEQTEGRSYLENRFDFLDDLRCGAESSCIMIHNLLLNFADQSCCVVVSHA